MAAKGVYEISLRIPHHLLDGLADSNGSQRSL